MLRQNEKELIIRVLAALFPDATIYLFGSRARGTHQPESDIDIAIDAQKPLDFHEIMQAKDVMEALRIPFKVDVVDFNRIPQDLRDEITQEGLIWKNGKKR